MLWCCQLIWLTQPGVSHDNKLTKIEKRVLGAVNELQAKKSWFGAVNQQHFGQNTWFGAVNG